MSNMCRILGKKQQVIASKTLCQSGISAVETIYKIIQNFLQKYPVAVSLCYFLIALAFELYFHSKVTMILFVASVGIIFVALKYKLDQSSYHKALFQDRFKIFQVLDGVLREWSSERKDDKELQSEAAKERLKRLNDIIHKAYYLFTIPTYEFIKEFRDAIIASDDQLENTPQTERAKEVRDYLGLLVNDENLLKKFPELKIDGY